MHVDKMPAVGNPASEVLRHAETRLVGMLTTRGIQSEGRLLGFGHADRSPRQGTVQNISLGHLNRPNHSFLCSSLPVHNPFYKRSLFGADGEPSFFWLTAIVCVGNDGEAGWEMAAVGRSRYIAHASGVQKLRPCPF